MCGLVGMAGDFMLDHRHVMKTLLFFNTLRGKDSTGVSVLNNRTNTVETRKLTCPGYDFVQQPWIDQLLTLDKGCWLGHGRYKTMGEISRLNAHPFEVRNAEDCISLFGAHNGTLRNKYELENELKERFGTDSEALLHLIHKIGPKEAIKKTEGAYALTWWRAEDNSINFLRNKERPLVYSFTEGRKVLIWASEPWFIRIACMRENVKLIKDDKGADIIYSVPEDTLLTFVIPDFTGDDRAFAAPKREGGLLGKPEKKGFWGGHGYGTAGYGTAGFGEHQQWWDDEELPIKPEAKEEAGKEGKAGKEKRGKDTLVGFEGQVVERALVNELKKSGCDWCGDVIHNENFAWLDEMDIVCYKCLRGEHFKVDVEEGKIVERILSIIGGKDKDKYE